MLLKESLQKGITEGLHFWKVSYTTPRNGDQAVDVSMEVGFELGVGKSPRRAYRVRVTPVFWTFLMWWTTNSTGSTGGLHEMNTTDKGKVVVGWVSVLDMRSVQTNHSLCWLDSWLQ